MKTSIFFGVFASRLILRGHLTVNKEQAIHVIEHLRGKQLSPLERMIVSQAWDNQSYEHICENSQYELQYIKKSRLSSLAGSLRVNRRLGQQAQFLLGHTALLLQPVTSDRTLSLTRRQLGSRRQRRKTDRPITWPLVDDFPGRALFAKSWILSDPSALSLGLPNILYASRFQVSSPDPR